MYKLNEDIKVKVTPEESREIQELAFKDGFSWLTSGPNVNFVQCQALYLHPSHNPRLLMQDLTLHGFDNEPEKELTPTELINLLGGAPMVGGKAKLSISMPNGVSINFPNALVEEVSSYEHINNQCDCGESTHNFGYHVRGCPAGGER